jgi:hypothetical protein
MIHRAWTFNADLAVKGLHFRLTLPMLEPLIISSIHYTKHDWIVLEGETRRPIYSLVSIDGATATASARAGEEKERTETQAQASPFLFQNHLR